ncbi:hypothetical protein CO540_20805 [Micromonospora sp. WMMA2032]|uniref:DUF6114 domain-containing protein n=1 Tax=unclassified Micromonospora TaxID=2617518 RepID=UPI000C058C26|nr:DUF6114 domain-containing protein [Micromonospora sp. WMMA2032]ATO15958.1 hypothetical protein CO540_20805 [Micromonospora sp. WMMA2032]
MTTAETQQARPGRLGQAWRGFRRWRRARPFWGGLFTTLAGLEIFATTQLSLNGLTFQMGPTGFLSWLIPTILVACGMLLWFSPAQRMFYAVVAAITALYSLIGVNLGGFFIGLLLGMVGSALGFAWVPRKGPAADVPPAEPTDDEPVEEPADEPEPALVDELLPRQREDDTTGVLTDTLPEPRNPLRESAPAEPAVDAPPADAPRGSGQPPRAYAILLVLAVSAAGLVTIRDERPAIAAPAACPTTSAPAPKPSASKTPTASPSASPSTTAPAEPAEEKDGNLLTDIVDGITGLFTGGDDDKAEPSPSPSASAVAAAAATPSGSATPKPSGSAKPSTPAEPGADCDDDKPAPTKPKPVEEGKPLPKLAADPDQPIVADPPSRLTGSKVTMTGLRFEGIVELPTRDGTLKCLKFTMDKAVTDDFTLLASGPAGKKQRYVTDRLTVEGDVAFYATRFVGYLLGIKITLTPDLPFPDGIPITSPIPISFTDPVIELAYENSKSLTARPVLRVDLA